jgi:phosphomannomutase
VLLEALSDHGGPLSALVAPYDKYAQSGEVNTKVADISGATDAVASAFATQGEADWADGLTVQGDGWWFNLRPSNTEPLLRLNVEADTPERMAEIRDRVQGIITAV